MPRIRCIKPDFWSDEKLARVSRESRLIFIGLWNFCDDYGVTHGDPVYLRSQLFPYDLDLPIETFHKWLVELEKQGFIIKLFHHENTYYYLPNFLKHQKIDHPSKTRNPDPSEMLRKPSRRSRESSRNPLDELGGEGEGKGRGLGVGLEVGVRVRTPDGELASKKKIDSIPYQEILDDLNQKIDKKYRVCGKVRELIHARWQEGFRLEDFQQVHNIKTREWVNNPDMCKYLRPETLYGTKFQSYKNQVEANPNMTETMRANLEAGARWLAKDKQEVLEIEDDQAG